MFFVRQGRVKKIKSVPFPPPLTMNLLLVLTFLATVLGCYTQVIDITDTNFDQVVKKSDQWVLEL
jgi:hypothetical protein